MAVVKCRRAERGGAGSLAVLAPFVECWRAVSLPRRRSGRRGWLRSCVVWKRCFRLRIQRLPCFVAGGALLEADPLLLRQPLQALSPKSAASLLGCLPLLGHPLPAHV